MADGINRDVVVLETVMNFVRKLPQAEDAQIIADGLKTVGTFQDFMDGGFDSVDEVVGSKHAAGAIPVGGCAILDKSKLVEAMSHRVPSTASRTCRRASLSGTVCVTPA